LLPPGIMDGETKSDVLPRWVRTLIVGRHPKWTFVRVAVVVIVTFILLKFVVIPIRVTGISMLPTYSDGSINFINRLAYVHSKPQRGDVIGVRFGAGEHLMYMKRVVGLPGETVSFHRGQLYINSQPIDEPYVKYLCTWEMAPLHLGPNLYYVVGDNRSMNFEDHYQFRADLVTQIVGKVIFKGKS
jgi:signal peptidase I